MPLVVLPKSCKGGDVSVLDPALAWDVFIWSTWSAVGNLTSRAGELRSAPSGPDARGRAAGKRALTLAYK